MKDEDFGSLFEDELEKSPAPGKSDDLFDFEDMPDEADSGYAEHGGGPVPETIIAEPDISPAPVKKTPETEPNRQKRSSDDFIPDMDALLITAQSSMIIDAANHLKLRDFSARTNKIYAEALAGLDLFIKILDRRPENYRKLALIFQQDLDCAEVEQIAFSLFRRKFTHDPEQDGEKMTAFEMLKRTVLLGFQKSSISKSIVDVKPYFHLTGDLNKEVLSGAIQSRDKIFISFINQLIRQLQVAINLLNQGEGELVPGLKGRNMQNYIIKVSQILFYYHAATGKDLEASKFREIYQQHKKYLVVK